MEEQSEKIEPFRTTLQAENENSKWKRISIIFIILTISSVILFITFAILYFTKENNDSSESDEPSPEDKWNWEPFGDRIKTSWGINLDPKKVWQEYPRPQLERKDWMNLNGPWKYSIRNPEDIDPDEHDGFILVPFPLESSLSGVMKNLTANEVIYYEKTVTIPKEWEGKHILLNFGAVDWKCEVFVNKIKVGEHSGGYSYFYFDITKYLIGLKNIITLRVTDITDTSYSTWGKYQPVGKQTITPNGIWYTPSSGIWQTVWLEPVNSHYINKIEVNNNYDKKEIGLNFKVSNDFKLPIEYCIKYNNEIIATGKGQSNKLISINITQNFKPWSPSEPNLYIITAELKSDIGESLDYIISYTTIRKIEMKEDSLGKKRIFLNDKPLFNIGPLDQGFWPDGLYTPPSEEAMVYDIQKLKDLGFNAIRKHVKVEPFRYYYECDKIGMVVWQDMPSGNVDGSGSWDSTHMDGGTDSVRTQESKDNYYKEWGEIIENLKFFQCIIVWTPFNEAWGQFETEAVVKFTQNKDNSRLINAASGGNHRPVGNFLDLHTYSAPSYPLQYDGLINVIGEYGGLGLEIKNHTWKKDNWSYNTVKTKEELTGNYTLFIEKLIELIPQGISSAIYTQVTDVEGEINGLITYDRKEIKVFDSIKEKNEKLIATLPKYIK